LSTAATKFAGSIDTKYPPPTGAGLEAAPEEALEVVLTVVDTVVLLDPPDDPPQPPGITAVAATAPRISFFIGSPSSPEIEANDPQRP